MNDVIPCFLNKDDDDDDDYMSSFFEIPTEVHSLFLVSFCFKKKKPIHSENATLVYTCK